MGISPEGAAALNIAAWLLAATSSSILIWQQLPRSGPAFIEISSVTVQTPVVAPGDLIRMEFTLRRNRACPTVANLRYADRKGVFLSDLTRTRPAIETPVSEAFVVVPRYVPTVGMDPGSYTYQPLYTCTETGEQVESPPVAFEIR